VVAQYHYFCLTALYNKERAYLLTIENQDDSKLSQEREVFPSSEEILLLAAVFLVLSSMVLLNTNLQF
jgi:hypothetical protein